MVAAGRFDLGAFLSLRADGKSDPGVFARGTALTEKCEALGYGSAWVNEHHFIGFGRCPAPMTMAAHLLARTTTLRVGTAVVLLGLHHPTTVAEEATLVSHLSGGRFDLGVGKGAYPRDQAAFGLDVEGGNGLLTRWPVHLALLADALEGDADGLPLSPDPRVGRPPVYIATTTPDTVAWAARHKFGLLLPYHLDLAGQRDLLSMYSRAADEAGVDASTVEHVATAVAYVAETDEKARAELREEMVPWLDLGVVTLGEERLRATGWGAQLDLMRERHPDGGTGVMADWLIGAGVVGSGARCREWFDELREVNGVHRCALWLDLAASDAQVDEQISAFAELAGVRSRQVV